MPSQSDLIYIGNGQKITVCNILFLRPNVECVIFFQLIEDCFKLGGFEGNDIDVVKNVETAFKCQRLCQNHHKCQFWTLNLKKKKCYRQTGQAPKKRNNKKHTQNLRSGPRFCSHVGTVEYIREKGILIPNHDSMFDFFFLFNSISGDLYQAN